MLLVCESSPVQERHNENSSWTPFESPSNLSLSLLLPTESLKSLFGFFPQQRLDSVTTGSRNRRFSNLHKARAFSSTSSKPHFRERDWSPEKLLVEPTNLHSQTMPQQHDSSQTVRVDVRLCGSIPRKDMEKHLLTENGARCSLTSLNVSPVNTTCLAAANGPTSDHSTDRTIDSISGLVQANDHNTTMPSSPTTATLYPTSMPLAPLMEPPVWAVAARGESRLEVSYSCTIRTCSRSEKGFLDVLSHFAFYFIRSNSPFVIHSADSLLWT